MKYITYRVIKYQKWTSLAIINQKHNGACRHHNTRISKVCLRISNYSKYNLSLIISQLNSLIVSALMNIIQHEKINFRQIWYTVFLKYALFFLHPSTQSHLYYKYVQKTQRHWHEDKIFHIILQASKSWQTSLYLLHSIGNMGTNNIIKIYNMHNAVKLRDPTTRYKRTAYGTWTEVQTFVDSSFRRL